MNSRLHYNDQLLGGDILKKKDLASSEKALVAKTLENTTFAHSLDMEERVIFDIGNHT